MDIYPKFIIETDDELGDCLIISKCTFHKEIATNKENVKGGGWFRIDGDNMYFYGESYDFGVAKIEDIKNAIKNKNVFTNPMLIDSIADKFNFFYEYGGEITDLN